MKIFKLIILLSIFINTNLSSQIISIYGTVKNESNNPLIGATIQINKNKGTTTDEMGRFALDYLMKNDTILSLSIRYIGYHEMDTIIFNTLNDIHIESKLIAKQHILPDLIIEGKRVTSILNKEKAILDYLILNNSIITLSNENNERIITEYSTSGILKTSKIVNKQFHKLHKSCKNNIHLIGKDSCCQIEFLPERIQTTHYDRNRFHQLIEKNILLFGNKHIFKAYSRHNKLATYFTYPNPSEPIMISEIYDKKAARVSTSYYRDIIRTYNRSISNPEESNISYGMAQNNILLDDSWDGDLTKLIISNELHQLVSYFLAVENRKVKVFEFEKENDLLIFDLCNYELQIFDDSLNHKRIITLEDEKIWNKSQIIQDDITSDIYVINKQNEMYLIDFTAKSLELTSKGELEYEKGIVSKLMISNNIIYYLNRNAHNYFSKICTVKIE